MWRVSNRTPYAAQGYFERDRDGAEYWVVAIRARFLVRGDGLMDPAERQEPVRTTPEYADEDARELVAESDFAPFRPRSDVLVTGAACAPQGRAVSTCDVRLRVGSLEKRARVFGARTLRRGSGRHGQASISAPKIFQTLPLSWRSALGGIDPFAERNDEGNSHPDNPIGIGWTARWQNLPEDIELALPAIEAVDQPISLQAQLPVPHGFGAVQRAWQPRLRHAGSYDEGWMSSRAPLSPLDFSEAFHQAAPPDQIYPGILRGGEPVEVEGLHPDGPYRFRLPQILFDIRTRIGAERTQQRPRLISVSIDGTRRMLDMTWNSHVPCTGRDHEVDGSTVTVQQIAGVAQ